MSDTGDGLATVHLLGIPLDLHQRSTQHFDELTREFFHLDATSGDVPQRLLALSDELTTRYEAYSADPRTQIEQAAAAAAGSIDVTYHVPAEVADAAQALADVLGAADEFCAAGDLLTLVAPPEVRSYRQWFLGEFRRQIAGEPPRPWSDAAGDAAPTD